MKDVLRSVPQFLVLQVRLGLRAGFTFLKVLHVVSSPISIDWSQTLQSSGSKSGIRLLSPRWLQHERDAAPLCALRLVERPLRGAHPAGGRGEA